jgi:8-oxo-dGTP diphosphatase
MIIAQNPSTADTIEKFFKAAFSVDLVLFTFSKGGLKVLLMEKQEEPYTGMLGFPGKLIAPNEDTDRSLTEYVKDLMGLEGFYFKQLKALSEVGRHPMGRVVTIAYYGLVEVSRLPSELPEGLNWHGIKDLPELSFDHNKIFKVAMNRFKKGLSRHPTVFELLPERFILADMMKIYEQAFGRKLDKPNFRRRVRKSELIKPAGTLKKEDGLMGRPPEYYSFDKSSYVAKPFDPIVFNF